MKGLRIRDTEGATHDFSNPHFETEFKDKNGVVLWVGDILIFENATFHLAWNAEKGRIEAQEASGAMKVTYSPDMFAYMTLVGSLFEPLKITESL